MEENKPEPQDIAERLAEVLGIASETVEPPNIHHLHSYIVRQSDPEECQNIVMAVNWGLRAAIAKGSGITPEEFVRGEGQGPSLGNREFLREYSIANPVRIDDDGAWVPSPSDSFEEFVQNRNAVAFEAEGLENHIEALEEMGRFIRRAIQERLFPKLAQLSRERSASREIPSDGFLDNILNPDQGEDNGPEQVR